MKKINSQYILEKEVQLESSMKSEEDSFVSPRSSYFISQKKILDRQEEDASILYDYYNQIAVFFPLLYGIPNKIILYYNTFTQHYQLQQIQNTVIFFIILHPFLIHTIWLILFATISYESQPDLFFENIEEDYKNEIRKFQQLQSMTPIKKNFNLALNLAKKYLRHLKLFFRCAKETYRTSLIWTLLFLTKLLPYYLIYKDTVINLLPYRVSQNVLKEYIHKRGPIKSRKKSKVDQINTRAEFSNTKNQNKMGKYLQINQHIDYLLYDSCTTLLEDIQMKCNKPTAIKNDCFMSEFIAFDGIVESVFQNMPILCAQYINDPQFENQSILLFLFQSIIVWYNCFRLLHLSIQIKITPLIEIRENIKRGEKIFLDSGWLFPKHAQTVNILEKSQIQNLSKIHQHDLQKIIYISFDLNSILQDEIKLDNQTQNQLSYIISCLKSTTQLSLINSYEVMPCYVFCDLITNLLRKHQILDLVMNYMPINFFTKLNGFGFQGQFQSIDLDVQNNNLIDTSPLGLFIGQKLLTYHINLSNNPIRDITFLQSLQACVDLKILGIYFDKTLIHRLDLKFLKHLKQLQFLQLKSTNNHIQINDQESILELENLISLNLDIMYFLFKNLRLQKHQLKFITNNLPFQIQSLSLQIYGGKKFEPLSFKNLPKNIINLGLMILGEGQSHRKLINLVNWTEFYKNSKIEILTIVFENLFINPKDFMEGLHSLNTLQILNLMYVNCQTYEQSLNLSQFLPLPLSRISIQNSPWLNNLEGIFIRESIHIRQLILENLTYDQTLFQFLSQPFVMLQYLELSFLGQPVEDLNIIQKLQQIQTLIQIVLNMRSSCGLKQIKDIKLFKQFKNLETLDLDLSDNYIEEASSVEQIFCIPVLEIKLQGNKIDDGRLWGQQNVIHSLKLDYSYKIFGVRMQLSSIFCFEFKQNVYIQNLQLVFENNNQQNLNFLEKVNDVKIFSINSSFCKIRNMNSFDLFIKQNRQIRQLQVALDQNKIESLSCFQSLSQLYKLEVIELSLRYNNLTCCNELSKFFTNPKIEIIYLDLEGNLIEKLDIFNQTLSKEGKRLKKLHISVALNPVSYLGQFKVMKYISYIGSFILDMRNTIIKDLTSLKELRQFMNSFHQDFEQQMEFSNLKIDLAYFNIYPQGYYFQQKIILSLTH